MTRGTIPFATSPERRRGASLCALGVVGAALGLAPGTGRGQIVLDGTTGAAGALTGPSYAIPNTLGKQVGQNLFHSFSDFNVHSGESATFTSAFAGTTQNIIGRVTGANVSQIDGLVASTVPGASLWLINPNGLVIGAGATLNVQGSFYASTADALLLPGGGRFDAANPQGSTLTVGNPVSFGFLDAQIGSISVTGATLRVPSGRTLALVGGSIDATSATLGAPAGHVVLASAAGATNIAVPGAIVAGAIGDCTELRASTRRDLPQRDVGDDNRRDGRRWWRWWRRWRRRRRRFGDTGRLYPRRPVHDALREPRRDEYRDEHDRDRRRADRRHGRDAARRQPDSDGHRGLRLAAETSFSTATGTVRIDGSASLGWWRRRRWWRRRWRRRWWRGSGGTAPSTASGLFSDVAATATGRGGSIDVSAAQLRATNGATLSSSTLGAGGSGDISLKATSRLTITQESQVNASTSGSGAGGNIRLEAPTVEALNGARIGSTAQSTGDGGDIAIVASGCVRRDRHERRRRSREQSRHARHDVELLHLDR